MPSSFLSPFFRHDQREGLKEFLLSKYMEDNNIISLFCINITLNLQEISRNMFINERMMDVEGAECGVGEGEINLTKEV